MKKIITISREFGSGGREIGLEVGKKLGLPVYDKYIIEQVALQTGFNEELVENVLHGGESRGYASSRRKGKFKINGVNIDDLLYNEESRVIEEYANKEACIFVGRCADFILKDRDDVLKIFIYADKEDRMKRVDVVHPDDSRTADRRIRDKDEKRASNYQYFTGRKWRNPENYDVMLNSSKLGFEKTVDFIVDLYKNY
jgi:hypothetical protein